MHTREERIKERFQALQAFYAEHGRLPRPKAPLGLEESRLGVWRYRVCQEGKPTYLAEVAAWVKAHPNPPVPKGTGYQTPLNSYSIFLDAQVFYATHGRLPMGHRGDATEATLCRHILRLTSDSTPEHLQCKELKEWVASIRSQATARTPWRRRSFDAVRSALEVQFPGPEFLPLIEKILVRVWPEWSPSASK